MQPVVAALALILAHTPTSDGAHDAPEAKTALEAPQTPAVVLMDEQAVSVRRPTQASLDAPQGPPLPAITRAEARRILSRPKGTLSEGKTNDGMLVKGRRIGLRGKGYAFFEHIKDRETHFGTYEMKRFIERTGKRFRKLHRRSTVGIGNVSIREGGKTRWHASHQSGRDVDIALFARDERGRTVNPRNFSKFDRDLKSPQGLTFDVEKNTDLVHTLLTDPEYQVQWIFIARWLRSRIIANAKKRDFPTDMVDRMAQVMKQPGDSSPHDDHFHVRLYCSVEDRMHGCVERGPVWSWVDLGDAVFEAYVDNLERILDAPHTKLRLSAIDRIQAIGARSAVPALITHLSDPERRVRSAALDTINTFRSPEAVNSLLDLVVRTESSSWASALFRAAMRSAGDQRASIARAFLADPKAMLHPEVAKGRLASFYGVVLRTLKAEADPSITPRLIALLSSPWKEVREMAQTTLQHVICYQSEHDAVEGDDAERGRAIAAWQALWQTHRQRTWADWVYDGIATAGYDLPENLHADECIEVLIEATGDKRDHIFQNAVRLLGVVTGHVVDPTSRSAKRHRKYWRRWWERSRTNTRGAN